MTSAYQNLAAYARKTETFESVARLAGWDQETYMPERAAPARGDQMGAMAELILDRETSDEFGDLLGAAEGDGEVKADTRLTASVREFRHDYDRQTRLPTDLVAEIARQQSASQQVWKKARAANDFQMFLPSLETMIELIRLWLSCMPRPMACASGSPSCSPLGRPCS